MVVYTIKMTIVYAGNTGIHISQARKVFLDKEPLYQLLLTKITVIYLSNAKKQMLSDWRCKKNPADAQPCLLIHSPTQDSGITYVQVRMFQVSSRPGFYYIPSNPVYSLWFVYFKFVRCRRTYASPFFSIIYSRNSRLNRQNSINWRRKIVTNSKTIFSIQSERNHGPT